MKLKAKKSPLTLFWLEPRLETFYVKFKIVLIFKHNFANAITHLATSLQLSMSLQDTTVTTNMAEIDAQS
jgi:hypothetical protein